MRSRLPACRRLRPRCQSLNLQPAEFHQSFRHAVVGANLSVEYMGERYPVTVATNDSTPLFDPDNSRVRT